MENYSIPKYPFYIVSKGRAFNGSTYRAFDKLKISYFVVVEEQEYDDYVKNVEPQGYGKVIVLDKKYQDDYDTFDDLGYQKSKGPGAARNFAWEHSMANGHKWHWVFDDNVSCFYRLNRNRRLPIGDGTMFRVMEEFCDRYENIAIAGPNYLSYAPDRKELPPYILNWRIYSMLLIRNDIPYRWRGRYNEDTDLSIRVMRDGWCTVQFNAFLGDKATTQTIKGGNNDDFYKNEGTLNKSQMLVDMHPDITELIFQYDRWHHKVDYRLFKNNKLKRIQGVTIPHGINNYGMVLEKVVQEEVKPIQVEVKEPKVEVKETTKQPKKIKQPSQYSQTSLF